MPPRLPKARIHPAGGASGIGEVGGARGGVGWVGWGQERLVGASFCRKVDQEMVSEGAGAVIVTGVP